MDDEIEDFVGDVKLTESQKSVTVSNVYSMDFTDSGSDKQNSSGMDTYVIEWDSEDSESSALRGGVSMVSMKDRPASDAQCEAAKKIDRATSSIINECCIFAQEIFTQTSKTIIELAKIDGAVRRPVDSNSLETQTSFISITENKTVEYRIEVPGSTQNFTTNEICRENSNEISCHQIFPNSIDDGSSKFVISDTENDKSDCTSDNSSTTNPKTTSLANADSKDNILLCENQNEYENTSDFDQSADITDIEEDSLMEPKVIKSENQSDSSRTPLSVDDDVAELYTKLYESMEFRTHTPSEHERQRFGYLTPLTEESVARKDSIGDVVVGAPVNVTSKNEETDKDVLFTNKTGIKIKLFPKADNSHESEFFKLPPIQGNANSPENLNFLFNITNNKLVTRTGNLPCVYAERKERNLDRWEMGGKNLAAGESALISGRSEPERASHASVQLPPIHAEGCVTSNSSRPDHHASIVNKTVNLLVSPCAISIKDKIRELKLNHMPRKSWTQSKYMNVSESRSGSPGSMSPDRLTDATERGCELLCVELLKRLRSHSWFEITEVLDDLPRVLDKFWGVMAEHRIADLIRQVTGHVESPRTQVARAACNTLAMILKNTNYTKKPDFYEAVTILLIKTGSFSRPVRRAANVALDDIVSSVDPSHSVTALCIHGSCHKSALVRCASARLLVVCCALGGGGRDLLRARPATAACARKHVLRSLAALLDDKNTEARKYAERLYSMLRPLSNFEAYYLMDVDVDLASKQMKKYDQLLLCGPPTNSPVTTPVRLQSPQVQAYSSSAPAPQPRLTHSDSDSSEDGIPLTQVKDKTRAKEQEEYDSSDENIF